MRINQSKLWRYIILPATFSILTTLITGLIPNQPEASIIGAYYYGLPKSWLVKIPLQNEINFITRNFIIDFSIFYILFTFSSALINWRKYLVRKTRSLKFLTIFGLSAFFTKIIAEIIHEIIGHGLFVQIFEGKITNINISYIWPYKVSSIAWTGHFSNWQMALIHGGGILTCLIFTGILQALLILRVLKNQKLTLIFFWLSFWTFLNPAGYLIIGGIRPFGDISNLISDGILTKQISLIIGITIFAVGYFSISRIFSDIIYKNKISRDIRGIRFYLALFWLLTFFLTTAAVIGNQWPIYYILLGILPAFVSLFVPVKMLFGELS